VLGIGIADRGETGVLIARVNFRSQDRSFRWVDLQSVGAARKSTLRRDDHVKRMSPDLRRTSKASLRRGTYGNVSGAMECRYRRNGGGQSQKAFRNCRPPVAIISSVCSGQPFPVSLIRTVMFVVRKPA